MDTVYFYQLLCGCVVLQMFNKLFYFILFVSGKKNDENRTHMSEKSFLSGTFNVANFAHIFNVAMFDHVSFQRFRMSELFITFRTFDMGHNMAKLMTK